MNSKLPLIFLAFLLAVAFVLTSAKKQKKKKFAKTKKSRVVQPTVVQRPQVVQPSEPVTEIKTEETPAPQTITEATPPVTETPTPVAEAPQPIPEIKPVVAQPTPEPAKPVEVVSTQSLKEFPKEVVKSGEFRNMGKVKIKISPVDEWPDMPVEDQIDDMKEGARVLRPFFVKEYSSDQYQQLVKDSEDYLKNPISYDPSKAGKIKSFLESLKSKRDEVASKGEVEYSGQLD